MKYANRMVGRALAVSSMAGLLAAGCAGNRNERAEDGAGGRQEDRQAADTVYYPDTGPAAGTGTGGSGDVPADPTATDTAGIYGDPNAWPTGPLPGDTGVGGAGTPVPDTLHTDSASPTDTFRIDGDDRPDDMPGTGMPGGGAGPDIY